MGKVASAQTYTNIAQPTAQRKVKQETVSACQKAYSSWKNDYGCKRGRKHRRHRTDRLKHGRVPLHLSDNLGKKKSALREGAISLRRDTDKISISHRLVNRHEIKQKYARTHSSRNDSGSCGKDPRVKGVA